LEIVLELASRKRCFLHKLKSIIITSNGLLPDRIISNYRSILAGLKGTGIDLVSVSSLDGMDETHDSIRGTKEAFRSVSRTIQGLVEVRREYDNFFMGLKTTILPQNINELDSILKFALGNNLFHIISPVFFTSGRFGNLDRRDELNLTTEDYHRILKFYQRQELDSEYYYHQAKILLASERRGWSCTAGYNYLFIEFDGQVYPCELTAEIVGDLRNQDIDSIWTGVALKRWRQRVGQLKSCSRCCEPGAIRYSSYDEGLSYRKFLMKLGRTDYHKSLSGEGYIKYFA
jgi:MoaA/NifB/PqqE/SkfB family radical SAM enzyme